MASAPAPLSISAASPADVPLILALIRELADYERMSAQVVATEADIERALFGERPCAEAVIARIGDEAVGFALFFQSFSTFVGRPGLYLEDLYVRPPHRGHGIGRRLLAHLAHIAVERGCGRFEWSVLDWNELAIASYRRAGAVPMDEWTVYRLTGEPLRALAAEAVSR
ncbi:MAG: GNAT family N-acetyltransferase [Acidobacteria bacterium]|nr:GNAT family N-acetyltransferase [Acidobacteriota bacterium]